MFIHCFKTDHALLQQNVETFILSVPLLPHSWC